MVKWDLKKNPFRKNGRDEIIQAVGVTCNQRVRRLLVFMKVDSFGFSKDRISVGFHRDTNLTF